MPASSRAYYNENDPKAAAWLRELIANGYIADGEVDQRSIAIVQPEDLHGFTQCHFFAGIGGWSLALRLAGWPDDRPVWTGSCPCQPFSSAGKQLAEKDPRHLWPEFCRLIGECAPARVFGEQVASARGREWLDGVCADLEALGFAVGAADLCAAGVGAPHIRQRLFWMADAECGERDSGWRRHRGEKGAQLENGNDADRHGIERCGLGHAGRERYESRRKIGNWGCAPEDQQGEAWQRQWRGNAAANSSANGVRMGNADSAVSDGRPRSGQQQVHDENGGAGERLGDTERWRRGERSNQAAIELETSNAGQPPASAGAWSDFDLIPCRDGKTRRIESGTFPLADGIPGRVGLLRGYGNAIVPEQAAQFILACEEALA